MKYKLHILLPLVFCFFIHLLYRADETLLNVLVAKTGINISPYKWFTPIPDFVMYNLPSGLWVYSLSLISVGMFFKKFNLFYLSIAIVMFIELLQLLGFTDGTFDVVDLFTPLLFFGFAWFYTAKNEIKIKSQSIQKAKLAIFATLLFAIFLSDLITIT